jgi:DNA polymerase-3 subunit delta
MSSANVLLYHGDDLFAIERGTAELLAGLGDPGMVDLNLARLDGRSASLDNIYAAANAMPFLSDRRVVILANPIARVKDEAARGRFRALLDELPESTLLILVIEDEIDRGDWKTMPEKKGHWLRKWLAAAGEKKAELRPCRRPAPREMPGWVQREVRAQGGQITPEAAGALAQHIGSDTQAASLEIEKLLIYVNYSRHIEIDDVELLSAQSGQASMFDMVDAIGGGNVRLALNLLHRLLEDEDENNLFGMIVRQFRLLIQTREMLDENKRADKDAVAAELHLHPYVATKLVEQAGRFKMPRLTAIYHRLLEIDEAVKTGQTGFGVALDTFVAELTR